MNLEIIVAILQSVVLLLATALGNPALTQNERLQAINVSNTVLELVGKSLQIVPQNNTFGTGQFGQSQFGTPGLKVITGPSFVEPNNATSSSGVVTSTSPVQLVLSCYSEHGTRQEVPREKASTIRCQTNMPVTIKSMKFAYFTTILNNTVPIIIRNANFQILYIEHLGHSSEWKLIDVPVNREIEETVALLKTDQYWEGTLRIVGVEYERNGVQGSIAYPY